MAQTTAKLSGVTINEIHLQPNGVSQDLDGDGSGDNNDEFIELVNTSGSSVSLDGWEIWSGGSSRHIFGSGDTIAAGGRFTVVDSSGSGSTIQNVTGPATFSTFNMPLDDGDDFILVDTNTNTYIVVRGANESGQISLTVGNIGATHGTVTQVGSTETLATDVFGSSHKRTTDGDDVWTTGTPDPGAPNCFAEGTLISTADGAVAVEALQIGMRVRVEGGGTAPILWIGRQTIVKRFWGARASLVRIKAGALGGGMPHKDLVVTGDHGMVLEGCVINASALINEGSVDWIPADEVPERYTVYHVETPRHAVIYANGAASESYLDIPGRRSFDNYQDYVARYGEDRPIAESRMPRIASSRLLPLAVQLRMFV